MEIIPANELPAWLKYPPEYLRLIEYGVVNVEPWYLLNRKLATLRYERLKERYPDRELFPFAARGDRDDIACWEPGHSKVLVIHDGSTVAYKNRRVFETFWDWFRQAIEDMIEHEP